MSFTRWWTQLLWQVRQTVPEPSTLIYHTLWQKLTLPPLVITKRPSVISTRNIYYCCFIDIRNVLIFVFFMIDLAHVIKYLEHKWNYCRWSIIHYVFISLLFAIEVIHKFQKNREYFSALYLAILTVTRCEYLTARISLLTTKSWNFSGPKMIQSTVQYNKIYDNNTLDSITIIFCLFNF